MSFSLSEVNEWIGGRIANESELGGRSGQIRIERVSGLSGSSSNEIAFFFSRYYEKELLQAAPGILVTGDAFVKPMEAAKLPLWKKSAIVSCSDPYSAMAIVSEKLSAKSSSVAHLIRPEKTEVHPTAVVHPSVELGKGVRVSAHTVIEESVKIGSGTVIYPGCFVGPGVTIGEDCVLFPNVTVYEWAQIGNRVRLHAGAVIGADGFGYAPKLKDGKPVGHQKIYHLGRVILGDDVEVGANSCVDRGTVSDTKIEKNVKLDNLVQVGHNAHLKEGAVVCGVVGVAGSATLGKYVYVGGLTGVTNQVEVGDGGKVGAGSMITKDIPPGQVSLGIPQREYHEHFRAHAALNRLLSGRQKGKK